MDYKIYYDGGTVYTGAPENAPAFGVLVIVQKNNAHGRYVVSNFDYFVWQGSEWMGCDFIGLVDYLQQSGWKKVLFGRMVEKEYFYDVVRQANDDPDFPPRTAYYKNEVKV
jgi:hypothetical protein